MRSVGVGGIGVCCGEMTCWMLGCWSVGVGMYSSYCLSNAKVYIELLFPFLFFTYMVEIHFVCGLCVRV